MAPRAAATSGRQSRTASVPTSLITGTSSTEGSTQGRAGGRAESPSNAHHRHHQLSEQPYRGLSDEVLAQIFEALHSAYQDDYIAVPPLAYLTISKRLYNITRPIWLSSFSTRYDAEYSDRVIAKLMTDSSLRPLVRQLEITFYRAFSQSQIAILTMLDNLRSIEVYFETSWPRGSLSGSKSIPAALLDAIASRPHLEELSFYALVEADHRLSETVNKRPLRVFTAPIHSIKTSLLEYLTVRRVKVLRLRVCLNLNQPFTGHLPWEDLSSVWFDVGTLNNGRDNICDVPEALGRQLLARSHMHTDARHLHVRLIFDSKAPHFGRVLRAFLDAFAPRRTRFTVEMWDSPASLAADEDQGPWNLVGAFELDAPYALTEGRNLADLAAFLDNMPAVTMYFETSWPRGSLSGSKSIPAALLDAIASRPHLEELNFYPLVEAKDRLSGPVVNKRPLRVFTAPIHSIKDGVLEYLHVRQVKTLNLTVLLNHDEPFNGNLPWEDLSTVKFELRTFWNSQAATCNVPEALGRQLLARGESDARLLNVGLEFNSRAPYFGRVLRAFLDAFAPRRTRFTVQAEGSPVLPAADNAERATWNLVETFELDAPYALTEGRNLADLASFLDNMPAVTDVSLRQVQLASSNGPAPVPVSALPDNRLGIEYPHLAGLLAHLAQSKITRLEVSSPSERGPVRWARERTQDPLVRVG